MDSTGIREESGTMGDKSPKSVRRQAGQKQAKNAAVEKKKQKDIAAKQVVFKKS
jgi:hypothetical protein